MDRIIGYLSLITRLVFLKPRNQFFTKKRKIVLLLISNIVMMYAVFIISIQPNKSIWKQVDDAYGSERSLLEEEEHRLYSIVLKRAREPLRIEVAHPKQLHDTLIKDISEEDEKFLRSLIRK